MSKPLSERLSQFTPDSSGLDRDALLFAAGRASVRPNRRWMIAAVALAACQVLTLGLLLPRRNSHGEQPSPLVMRRDLVAATPALPPDVSELGSLTRQFLAAKDNDFPPAVAVANLIPSDPPLTSHSVSDLAEMK